MKTRTGVPCPHPEKERQPNEYQAEKALGKLVDKFGPQGSLHAYLCPCGYWHLGRANREPKTRRERDVTA